MIAKPRAPKLLLPSHSWKRALHAWAVLQLGVSLPALGATYYWDTNSSAPGSGVEPHGTWSTGGNTWSTSIPGTGTPGAVTTGYNDDLIFSAGTDATESFVSGITDTQKARFLVFRNPTTTVAGGILDIQNSNSGLIFEGSNQTVYFESSLNLSGASYINTKGASNHLWLYSQEIVRNRGAALNFLGGGVVTLMGTAGLETDAHGMMAGWVTVGTGNSTTFATSTNEGTLAAYQGTAAADASQLTSDPTANYDLASALGTAPNQITANSIRYRGAKEALNVGSEGMQVNALLNASGNELTVSGGSLTSSDTLELIMNSSSGNIEIKSAITDHEWGSVSISKHGQSGLYLTGDNSFTGDVHIQQGVLYAGHANALGMGSGVTYLNANSSTNTAGALALQGNVTIHEDVFVYGSGDGSFILPATTGQNWGHSIFSQAGDNNSLLGTITLMENLNYRFGALNGTRLNLGTIQRVANHSSSIVFSATGTGMVNVTQAMKLNNSNITMHGGGWARFAASFNEIGDIVVANTSELVLAANHALNMSKALTMGATGSGSGGDVASVFLEGVTITINSFSANRNTSGTIAATQQRVLSGYSSQDSTLEVGYAGGGGSFDGILIDGAQGGKLHFTKLGNGAQNFVGTAANTYTGVTKVHGGILHLGKSANVVSVSGNLEIGNAQDDLDVVRLGAHEQIADTSKVSFQGSQSAAGVLRLNGFNETVAGVNSVNGSGVVENLHASTASKLVVAPAQASQSHEFDGIIQNGGAAALAFEKMGAGSQALSGASTYTGGTEVKAGTLYVNNVTGSATGSGAVTVQAAGTLAGTGRISLGTSARANLQGTLSPGSTQTGVSALEIQVASASGASSSGVTLNHTKMLFQLGVSGSSESDWGTSDQLVISGTLNEASDITFSGTSHFDFNQTGQAGWYKLVDSAATTATTWSGITVNAATQEITAGLTLMGLGTGMSGSLFLGNGTTFGDFGDVYLQVVPEPSRAALVLLGLMGFIARRKR